MYWSDVDGFVVQMILKRRKTFAQQCGHVKLWSTIVSRSVISCTESKSQPIIMRHSLISGILVASGDEVFLKNVRSQPHCIVIGSHCHSTGIVCLRTCVAAKCLLSAATKQRLCSKQLYFRTIWQNLVSKLPPGFSATIICSCRRADWQKSWLAKEQTG